MIYIYTLPELTAIGDAAVKTNLSDLDPTIPGSFIRAIIASCSILAYAIQRNIKKALADFFPQTGSGEFLDFWAEINALTRVPGTVAAGNVAITGTLTTSVPLGTVFASTGGSKYTSTSAVTITSHVGSVTLTGNTSTVTAVTPVIHGLVDQMLVDITGATDTDFNGTGLTINVLDEFTFTYPKVTAAASDSGSYSSDFADVPLDSDLVGSDQNLSVGALMSLVSTVIGIAAGEQGTVNRDGITAGTDLETDDSFRSRVLQANAIDPGVFTSAQIRSDARTIPTATRVFVTVPSINFTTDGTDVVGRVPDGLSETGDVATIDMTANGTDNIYVGSTITVAGVTPSGYNGDWTVLSVTATAITYTVGATLANSSVHGTVSLDKLKNIPQPGRCYVFVLDDNNDPPNPSSTTLTNVSDKVLLKLPAHTTEDDVIFTGPFFESIPITITGLSPDSTAMRAAVENNLNAFFQDSAKFAESIKHNQLISAIQNTQDLETGVFVDSFTLTTPTADVSVGNGTIGILGAVTFA